MKHAFVLVQIVFGSGFFAAVMAQLGRSVPLDLAGLTAAVGGYAAACLLVIAFNDYSRGSHRRPLVVPRAVVPPRVRTPQLRPVPATVTASAAVLSCRTLSGA